MNGSCSVSEALSSNGGMNVSGCAGWCCSEYGSLRRLTFLIRVLAPGSAIPCSGFGGAIGLVSVLL
eukprot:4842112-Pyramimonas_sp.AAC.1